MSVYDDINRLLDRFGSFRTPTPQENREQFGRILVCGDTAEFDNFICVNLRLVAEAIKKFLKRQPATYMVDDLFSTGLHMIILALKTVLEQAREDPETFESGLGREDDSGHFHVMMYLYISVYQGIQKCYEQEAVRAISGRTTERFTPEGGSKPIQKVDCPSHVFERIECDPFEMVYLWEDILDHCRTTQERDVITMRLTLRDCEIAKIFGCTSKAIRRIRTRVFRRYQTSLGEIQA